MNQYKIVFLTLVKQKIRHYVSNNNVFSFNSSK